MKKQRNVVFQLSLITISLFTVFFIIYNVISSYILYTETKETSEQLITLSTNKTSVEISDSLNTAGAILHTDRQMLLSLQEQNQLTSALLIEYKERALKENPHVLGYSIILKANELSSISPEHLQYIDRDGYFALSVIHTNGQISFEAIADSTKGAWYTTAAASKKLEITEPFEHEVNGDWLSMINISLPIIQNNNVIGMTIAEFPLNFLDTTVAANTPATAIQRVASASGIIISDSGNPNNINTSLEQFVPPWVETLATLQAGNNTDFYADSVTFGEQAYAVFAPVHVRDYDQHLIVQTFMPKSSVLSMYNRILYISIAAAIAIAILLAVGTYFSIYRALKPLNNVQRALRTAAQGELTISVNEKLLANDEIGAVGRAYNTMRNQVASVIRHVTQQAHTIEQTAHSANRGVEEISQSSQDMSKAIDDIAAGAQSQANEIESANRELVQLGAKIDTLSTMATHILNNVEQSNHQAQKGRTEIHKLHTQSEQTSHGNEELELQMTMLASQISQIDTVMHSIQAITEQTNLLALNASIEAARAGEYGKGFAVVADEVRKLAEQSKRETDHVQTIVSNILRESEQTKQLAARNTTIFKEQMTAVTSTEAAFSAQLTYAEQIELHIKELLHELKNMLLEKELVITSMQSIAAISEQSASSAEEISASAEEQYNEMLKIVARMNELHDISIALKQKAAFFKVS